jgi:chorismate mutase
MTTRGIRGATTIDADEESQVLAATRQLLEAVLHANPGLETGDIASALFTVTEDITSAFPARAARQMGWEAVPMLCAREIPVPGSLPRCIRLLIHWNTRRPPSDIRHVYLREAVRLRPDLPAVELTRPDQPGPVITGSVIAGPVITGPNNTGAEMEKPL